MARIADLIKQNAVPAAVMHSAARGALSVPPEEMMEILVYLTRNPVFGEQARMTLAGWDEASSISVAANPATAPEILGYLWAEENRRPRLMPALIENPSIPETELMELAGVASREILDMLLASPRVMASPGILSALAVNDRLTPAELQKIQGEASPESVGITQYSGPDGDLAMVLEAWELEHAAEIAAEEGKAFELTGPEEELEAAPAPVQPTAPVAIRAHAAARSKEKLTVLQKVARMSVAERVKAAFTGGKDERSILIRDGSKVVQNAVMASPKLTEPEVENFAAAKNLQENVLREIAHSRKFMKSYNVGRNLVNNPRCPLDISLTLVKNLRLGDLKELRRNKNVADTIRQVATKLYKQRMSGGEKK